MFLSRLSKVLPLNTLLLAGSVLFLAFNPPHAQAEDAQTSAKAFVSDFGAQIATIINSPITLGQKKREILPLMNKNVDIPAIGKYCLGHYWAAATEEEQAQYLELFKKVLMHAITTQIGNYQNISIHVLDSTPTPIGEKINALVTRPNQAPIRLTVVTNGTPPKLVDIYTEGMSVRLTQRSDYNAFLSSHNGQVKDLIAAMKKQVEGYEKSGGF